MKYLLLIVLAAGIILGAALMCYKPCDHSILTWTNGLESKCLECGQVFPRAHKCRHFMRTCIAWFDGTDPNISTCVECGKRYNSRGEEIK